MTIRILSFDGGGVKAVGLPSYIQSLEKQFQTRLTDRVQAYSGASAGAIVAVLSSLGFSGIEIEEKFRDTLPIAFKPKPWWKFPGIIGSKYSNENLREALAMALGPANLRKRMCDLPTPVFIPVTDLTLMKSKVYDCDDEDLVLDVLEKTCAAPTYFDPVDQRYVDGGVWANNPSMVGLLGYLRKHPKENLENIRLYSFGHGKPQAKNRLSKSRWFTPLHWINPLLFFMIDGHEEGNHFYANNLPLDRYLRVEVNSNHFDLDDVGALNEIIAQWRAAAAEFEKRHNEK